jgi:hypothetical protein
MTETFYAWVRVGDGNPEPAAVEGKKGERKATTLGCPDPFLIDEKGCPCKLLYDGNTQMGSMATMEPPDDEISASEARKREREYRAYMRAARHSYAGFGRRGK